MKTIYETELTGAGMWSKVIGRGKNLRLTDLEGGANVGCLLYNALERTERYNMPDTLKGQQVFFLTEDLCLHSDMGRVLGSIVKDTAGWHDTVCGTTAAPDITAKYGGLSYQDGRNEFHRNGRECFLIELAKWGLGEQSLVPNINFFSKVVTDEGGQLSYETGCSRSGAQVTIRLEMDCLVVLNTCPHPLDPKSDYSVKPVKLEVLEGVITDHCRASHPENERALANTETYHQLRF